MYRIIARRLSPLYGLLAMLFPLVAGVYQYAYEARGYGPALGFAALALMWWDEAAEKPQSVLARIGLAISTVAAVSLHYYAVLMLVPLSVGELIRTAARRRIDPWIWVALCLPAIPLGAFSRVIEAARGYSGTFWAVPSWGQVIDTYSFLLWSLAMPLTCASILAVGYAAASRTVCPHVEADSRVQLPRHTLACLGVLMVLPVIGVIVGKYVTHAYYPRYVLYPLYGFSLIAAFATHGVARGRKAVALGACFVLLASFVFDGYRQHRTQVAASLALREEAKYLMRQGDPSLPIVVTQAKMFYQLSFYVPPALRNRLIYAASPPDEVRYLGFDTIDRGLLDLRHWFPLRTAEYHAYVASHPDFLVYGDLDRWTWQMYGFVSDGFEMSVLARHGDNLMVRAHSHLATRIPFPAGVSPSEPEMTEAVVGLSRQRAGTASMCKSWTNDKICGLFQ
jgi:hypothetical protein